MILRVQRKIYDELVKIQRELFERNRESITLNQVVEKLIETWTAKNQSFSRAHFRLIEKKLRRTNPILLRDTLLDAKLPKYSHWKLLKRVWKKSRGNAIAYILMLPLGLFKVMRSKEKTLDKYQELFVGFNEKLREKLPKAEKESEKMFLKTFIDLNNVAIKMNSLLLAQNRRIEKGNEIRETFNLKPTTKNLLRLWNFITYSFELNMEISELKRKKADIQDDVMEYERQMSKFDKKDIEDFRRAVLTDIVISYTEKKILLVGTPIEILLKSSKLMNKIRRVFLLTEALRVSADITEETQINLVRWFDSYEGAEKNCT